MQIGVFPPPAAAMFRRPSSAIVIGGGVAGASIAKSLAECGVGRVTVLEKAGQLCAGATCVSWSRSANLWVVPFLLLYLPTVITQRSLDRDPAPQMACGRPGDEVWWLVKNQESMDSGLERQSVTSARVSEDLG